MANSVDGSDLEKTLDNLEKRSLAAAKMYLETKALQLQGKAQQRAEWTDRTAHARQRIKGTLEADENMLTIKLAHGVEYGVFLELAHEKKYAILWPVVNEEKTNIVNGLSKLLERFKLV